MLEAKGLGTPVIVADGCAGREEIEDGVSGLWFKSGDAEDLARTLDRISDDGLVNRLAHGAYTSFWSKPPTLARHIEAITAIYEEMIARQMNTVRPFSTSVLQAAE